MCDYYLFPLPRASKWNRPIFDHSDLLPSVILYLNAEVGGLSKRLKIKKEKISK